MNTCVPLLLTHRLWWCVYTHKLGSIQFYLMFQTAVKLGQDTVTARTIVSDKG